MSAKIINDSETRVLFAEVLKHPLFILECKEYEKSKLLELAFEERTAILLKASKFLGNLDTSILTDLEAFRFYANKIDAISSQEKRQFFFHEISETAIPLKVLFANLGFEWNFETNQLRPKEPTTPDKKAIDTKGIVIDSNIIESIILGLKPFFSENEQEKLKLLLNGEIIEGQLTFDGKLNQLPELIKRLEYNDKIIRPTEKTALGNWLKKYFITTEGEFNQETLKGQLSKTAFKIKKENRLCPEIPILSESQLKQRKQEK